MASPAYASKLTKHLLRTALVLSLPILSGASVYRWVDENGVVNFSQQAPRNVPENAVEEMNTQRFRTNVVSASDNQPRAAEEPQLTAEQQALLDDIRSREAAIAEQEASARAETCERARSTLQRLQNSARMRVRSRDGSERIIGEDERQQRIADAKDVITANC